MSTSSTSRRRFLSNIATAGSFPLIGCVSNRPTFDVDIYVASDAYRGQSVNHAATFLEQKFSELYGTHLDVGPEGVIEIPEHETLKDLAEWWHDEYTHTAEHASILCVDYVGVPKYWGYTHEFGEPPSVVRFASNMDTQAARWIVLHEVGHALGARHSHSTDKTIMSEYWEDVDKSDLEYSTRTKQVMLEHL